MATADPQERVRTKTKIVVQVPKDFKILYLNDNVTTMEFVVHSLMKFFDYTEDGAHKITLRVHEEGSAVVAVMPYELAEQKGVEVTLAARKENFPLVVKLEENE